MRKTYIQIDGRLVEKSKYYAEPVAPGIMPDIQPYQSMADGSMITSRSQHRAHLRQHNCIEIGNEKMEAPPPPVVDRDARRRTLYQQLDNVTDRQANTFLAGLKAHSRGR